MNNLPESLRGPFESGYYVKSKARLLLKKKGSYQIVDDVFPAMFIPSRRIKYLPDLSKFVTGVVDEGAYHRFLLNPDTKRSDVDYILAACKDNKVYPLEADVDPLRRWFSDTGAAVSVTGKAFFFDLETHPLGKPGFDDEAKAQHQIISIAAHDLDGNKYFWCNTTCDDAGEERVLKQFLDVAKNYDTLLAWNGNDYDFFVLKARCDYLDLYVEWHKWNLLDYMLVVKKCLMSVSDPKFKRSFALDNIGQNVLGIKKLEISVAKTEMDRLIKEGHIKELKAYNSRDVEIMIELERKREFLMLHQAVCAICRKFPDRNSLFPNTLMDGVMLRLAVEEGRHFKSRYANIDSDDEEVKFPGAFVMDAVLGYHESVQVIDFASLYPSIIISWNISPDTKVGDFTPEDIVKNHSCFASASGIRFRTDREGLLPMALRQLIEKRKEYSKKQKEATVGTEEWKRYGHESTALKVVANSMYGLLGSPYSRYYDTDLAKSVTLTGQYLIKEVIAFAQSIGYQVIASDTDSSFIKATADQTREIVKRVNSELIPRLLNEARCRAIAVKMDYDKGYSRLLIQAKKKYAGQLSLYKGNPAPPDMEPDIKGLEFQRSDQIKYAQRMQMAFVKLLLDPNVQVRDIETEIRKYADEFYSSDIKREDIEITQAVTKKPEEYPNPTPAVRVAAQMLRDGRDFAVGMKVPYIIASSQKDVVTAIHADDYQGNFDRKYYWTKKVIPLVERLVRVRFQDCYFDQLDTLIKNPNQGTLEFDSMPMKTRQPKLPDTPQPGVKVRKAKFKTVKFIFEEQNVVYTTPKEQVIKAVSKLVKAAKPGNIKLSVVVVTKGAEVTISTDHMISQECIDEVRKMFKSCVKIEE